jgi:hypothetical protein
MVANRYKNKNTDVPQISKMCDIFKFWAKYIMRHSFSWDISRGAAFSQDNLRIKKSWPFRNTISLECPIIPQQLFRSI